MNTARELERVRAQLAMAEGRAGPGGAAGGGGNVAHHQQQQQQQYAAAASSTYQQQQQQQQQLGQLANGIGLASAASKSLPAGQVVTDWTEHVSPDGRPFYWNPKTGQSVWTKPQELADAQAAAAAVAAANATNSQPAGAGAGGASGGGAGGGGAGEGGEGKESSLDVSGIIPKHSYHVLLALSAFLHTLSLSWPFVSGPSHSEKRLRNPT